MACINYNDYDLSYYHEALKPIFEYLGLDEVEDEAVWERARESEEIPVFENILYEMLFSELERFLSEEKDVEITYNINAHDTSMSVRVDDVWQQIDDLDDFKEALEEIREIRAQEEAEREEA